MGQEKKIAYVFLFLLNLCFTEKLFPATASVGFTQSDLCTKPNTQFTDTSTISFGSIDGWDWNFGDPASGANNTSQDENPTHQYASPGVYLVTLTTTDDSLHTATASHSITILPSPTANFSFAEVCFGDPMDFHDLSTPSSGETINGWFWSFGDLTTSSLQNPTKLYGAAFNYTVSLIATSTNGCTDQVSKTMKVHAYPHPSISTQPVSCVNASHSFLQQGSVFNDSISSWHWSFGATGTDSVQNPSYVFTSTGTKEVILKVTSNGGCSGYDTTTVDVEGPPSAAFTFSPQAGYPPLNVTCSPSSPAASYFWDFGDGYTFTADTVSHVYSDTGTYSICLVATSVFGCLDTSCNDILVKKPNTDIAIIDIIPTQTGNSLALIVRLANYGNLTLTSSDLFVDIGGNTGIIEKWTGSLKPGEDMLYFFHATFILNPNIMDAFVCVEAQNPNHGTDDNPLNNKDCRSFGQQFHAADPYPNPAHDRVTLEYILPESSQLDLTLYDMLGKKIRVLYSDDAFAGLNIYVMDLSAERKGIYTIRAEYEGNISIKRVLKY